MSPVPKAEDVRSSNGASPAFAYIRAGGWLPFLFQSNPAPLSIMATHNLSKPIPSLGPDPIQIPRPPTIHLSSCDPRWKQPYVLHTIKYDDTATLLRHYRASAQYWQQAYVAIYEKLVRLSETVRQHSIKEEDIEACSCPGHYHQKTSDEELPGAQSPKTPQAMTADDLPPMEPAWLK
ncbi:hypothetical protein JX265_009502 [Neoarthrinium moseri]|uniref:Uncharacterized protein n=1 Tax=Neoarthrinium moseri TaxID=1658444 RepID=A0A9Q0AJ62_9PEZI|nr:hypothetical protein JX265_009502 [Neoarthrinium moseri]